MFGFLKKKKKNFRVYKTITGGASYYGRTEAAGDAEHIKRTGMMCCGSGDDHCVTAKEMEQIENHNPAKGDLELESGPLKRYLLARFRN